MILVLNEWVFHDLLGENGPDAFRQTATFIAKLNDSYDKLVMPTEERWRGKAYQLMTTTSTAQREVSKLLHSMLRNTNQCIRLLPTDIPVTPQGTYDWAPPEDVYLIEAYVASNADRLVTTDGTLFDNVADHGQFTCQMRDDFLAGYGLSS